MKKLTTPMLFAAGLLASSHAMAVYNQQISVTGDSGEPLDGVTLTLEIPGTDPVTVTDNGEGDDDDRVGIIGFPLDDSTRGKTATLITSNGGDEDRRTVILGGPLAVSMGGGSSMFIPASKENNSLTSFSIFLLRNLRSTSIGQARTQAPQSTQRPVV